MPTSGSEVPAQTNPPNPRDSRRGVPVPTPIGGGPVQEGPPYTLYIRRAVPAPTGGNISRNTRERHDVSNRLKDTIAARSALDTDIFFNRPCRLLPW